MLLVIVAVVVLVALLVGEKVAVRPTVDQLRLRQRIVAEGDDVLLDWRVHDACTITVRDPAGYRHRIGARGGQGTTPLRLRSDGYLVVEVSNLGRTVTTVVGPVRIVRMPAIRHVTIGDPDLHRASDADVADLADGLHRLARVLPDWRTARPPASRPATDPERPRP